MRGMGRGMSAQTYLPGAERCSPQTPVHERLMPVRGGGVEGRGKERPCALSAYF